MLFHWFFRHILGIGPVTTVTRYFKDIHGFKGWWEDPRLFLKYVVYLFAVAVVPIAIAAGLPIRTSLYNIYVEAFMPTIQNSIGYILLLGIGAILGHALVRTTDGDHHVGVATF